MATSLDSAVELGPASDVTLLKGVLDLACRALGADRRPVHSSWIHWARERPSKT